MKSEDIYSKILEIKNKAVKQHGDFNSLHEGYAVILEEVDELWDEVKKKKPDVKNTKIECLQIAAMCIKLYEYLEKK